MRLAPSSPAMIITRRRSDVSVALVVTLLTVVAAVLTLPVLAQTPPAAAPTPSCTDASTAAELANCGLANTGTTAKLGTKGIEPIIGNLIQGALSLIGVAFLILMVYAGIRWMTAQGDAESITKAKDTIRAAIIGMVLTGLAFAITTFVLQQLASAT